MSWKKCGNKVSWHNFS